MRVPFVCWRFVDFKLMAPSCLGQEKGVSLQDKLYTSSHTLSDGHKCVRSCLHCMAGFMAALRRSTVDVFRFTALLA